MEKVTFKWEKVFANNISDVINIPNLCIYFCVYMNLCLYMCILYTYM